MHGNISKSIKDRFNNKNIIFLQQRKVGKKYDKRFGISNKDKAKIMYHDKRKVKNETVANALLVRVRSFFGMFANAKNRK